MSYLSRIERVLFSPNCYVSEADQAAKRVALEALENSLPGLPLPIRRAPAQDVFEIICGYTGRKSHMVMQAVSSRFHKAVGEYLSHRLKCPAGTDPKLVARYFASAIDADVIAEHLGEVDIADIPPVPKNFIDQARAGFRLVYIPESITIEVDEDPDGLVPTGRMRKIEVYVTASNLVTLALSCQKGANLPSQFAGTDDFSERVLAECSNVGVKSHWSYQQDAPTIGMVSVLTSQWRGVRQVSLIDRLFFYFLAYMQSGVIPTDRYPDNPPEPDRHWTYHYERTSTRLGGARVFTFPTAGIRWFRGDHQRQDGGIRLSIGRFYFLAGYTFDFSRGGAEEIIPQSPGGVI